MVRFHTGVLVFAWSAACGSGPAGPKATPAEPPSVAVEATLDAAIAEPPPPPKLVCPSGSTPAPAAEAGWYCTRADGVRHGPFVELFPDGTIAVRGTYVDNQLDGAWQRHHPDGAIAERGAYVAGKQDGRWIQTSASGEQLGEYTMTAGTGTEKRWYESGAIASELALKHGVPHGTAKQYAVDGRVLEISKYVNGKLDGSRAVGTYGSLRIEESYQHGVRYGTRKLWYFNLLLLEENYDRSGRLHGDYTIWRSKRVARVKGNYDHGKREGTWVWNDRADKKEREGSYVSGKKHGTWTEWWETKVTFVGNYTNGKPDGTFTYYDRGGNELGSFTMSGGTGTMQTFHTNKKPSSKQRLYKGYEDGVYQELTPRGKVLVEGHFRGGQKHGAWKEWTHDGVLVLEQQWQRGKLHGAVKKYVDGKLSTSATYAEGKANGAYTEYRAGKPAVTGQFADDLRTGAWTHYDSDGSVTRTATYQNGQLEGPYRELVTGFVLEGEMKAGRRTGTWTKTDKAGVVRKLDYGSP